MNAKTILLVEDDGLIALAEISLLKSFGYNVLHAFTGEKAVSLVQSGNKTIDLILMDINLGPGMDGTEAAEEIIRDHDIPVVFLSAHTEQEIVEKTERISSYGYVVKNSGSEVLGASIKMAFKLHDALRLAREANDSLSLALEASKAGVWDWNILGNTFKWSREMHSVFGFSSESVAGFESWNAAIHPDDRETANRKIREAIDTRTDLQNEYRIIRPDGKIRWIRAIGKTFYASDGRPARMAGLCIDITDRRRVEEKLQRSETRYRELFENIDSGVVVYEVKDGGRDFIIKDFNRAGEEMDRVNRDQMIGKSVFEVRPGIEAFGLIDIFRSVWKTGRPRFHPAAFYRDERISDWYENYVYRISPDEIVAVFRNVTERKKAEEALRANEAQLKNAMKIASLGHWELDVESGRFTFSDEFYSIFRTTAEEMGGYHMSVAEYASRFVHPEDAPQVEEETRKALETDDPHFSRYLEHRMLYADGSLGYLAVRIFIVKDDRGKTIKTYGVNQDITEQKRAAEALRETAESLIRAQRIGKLGSWDWDVTGNSLAWSEEVYRIWGLERGDPLTFERIAGMIHPDDRTFNEKMVQEFFGSRNEGTYEFRIRRPDGSLGFVSQSVEVVRDSAGRPNRMFGIMQDISDRKKAEEALQKNKDNLRALIDNVGGIVWSIDRNYRLIVGNRAFHEQIKAITGCEFMIGENILERSEFSKDDGEWRAAYDRAFQGEQYFVQKERRFSDRSRWMEFRFSPIRAHDGEIIGATVSGQDITERKQSENQIRALLKEKDVLLRDTHHRIKNNMEVISALFKLQASKSGNPEVSNALLEARNRVKSMELLYHKLYCAPLTGTLSLQKFLTVLIREIVDCYPRAKPLDVEIRIEELEMEAKRVAAIGLIINEMTANCLKHAFPEGKRGRLTITAAKRDGRFVIRVEDDGIGIPEGVSLSQGGGVGFQLIEMLASQISGVVSLERPKRGSAMVLEIPLVS